MNEAVRPPFRDFLKLIVDLWDGTCVMQAYASVPDVPGVARSGWARTISEAITEPVEWYGFDGCDCEIPNYVRMRTDEVLVWGDRRPEFFDTDAYHAALQSFAHLIRGSTERLAIQRDHAVAKWNGAKEERDHAVAKWNGAKEERGELRRRLEMCAADYEDMRRMLKPFMPVLMVAGMIRIARWAPRPSACASSERFALLELD